MKLVYTDDALQDLDEIFSFLADQYPSIIDPVETRIREVMSQIADWPESKPRLDDRSDVRVAFLGKYPYRIFYRADGRQITILHVHHTARLHGVRPSDRSADN